MNNSNNNEELNSISLGNMGPSSNQEPVPSPVPSIESLDSIPDIPSPVNDVPTPVNFTPEVNNMEAPVQNNQPMSNNIDPVPPLEPVEQVNNGQANASPNPYIAPTSPVPPENLNYEVPESINSFSPTPVFNDIGTVPPIPNGPISDANTNPKPEKKKKKGMPKTLFVLLILVAIAAVGVGVYMYLGMSNKSSVAIKNVKIELGDKVPTTLSSYATVSGGATCSINTSGITDTNKLGAKYEFIVTCGKTTYKGIATIVDSKAPEVKLKEVTVGLNGSVKAEDFVDSCTDKTKCSFKFKDENEVKNMVKTAGTYKEEVIIIASDEQNNEVELKATLIVGESSTGPTTPTTPTTPTQTSSLYLTCAKENTGYTEQIKLGLTESKYNKENIKVYVYKLTDTEYNTLKAENSSKTSMTYKNTTGKPEFSDTDKTLSISSSVPYDTLKSEVGADLPESISDLKTLYTNKGYTCTIGY